jgi:hypothetical protein
MKKAIKPYINESTYKLLVAKTNRSLRTNVLSHTVDSILFDNLSENIQVIAQKMGLKILKIDVTDFIKNRISRDIAEGRQTIHFDCEMFVFSIVIEVEIEENCIGDEKPENVISSISYIDSHLYNTSDYEGIEFDFDPIEIIENLK